MKIINIIHIACSAFLCILMALTKRRTPDNPRPIE
jgi:hypothetical protein